jgi:hypothetical protein
MSATSGKLKNTKEGGAHTETWLNEWLNISGPDYRTADLVQTDPL